MEPRERTPIFLARFLVANHGSHLVLFQHPRFQTRNPTPVPEMGTLRFFNRITLKPEHKWAHDGVKEATNWSLFGKQIRWLLLLFLTWFKTLRPVHSSLLYRYVDVLTLLIIIAHFRL